jgi:hypothetical protein
MTTPLTALGTGIEIDYTTASNPVLKIPFNAIKNALSWTNVPTNAGTQDLDPWIASILQALADWNSTVSTTMHDVVVEKPYAGVQSRNNIDGRTTYSYTATVFSQTPVASKPDADDL